jgi:hypothetical protein
VPVLFFLPAFTRLEPSDDWDKINADGEVKILNMVANVVESINNLAVNLII